MRIGLRLLFTEIEAQKLHSIEPEFGALRLCLNSLDTEQQISELRKRIAGREKRPSREVFQNIQHFKDVPAGNLLMVMDAFSRALGVNCSHCHSTGSWEKKTSHRKRSRGR